MSKNIWWEKRQYLIFELFDWILNFNWFPIVIKKSFIIYVCFIKIDWWKICMSTFMYFLSDIKIWKFIFLIFNSIFCFIYLRYDHWFSWWRNLLKEIFQLQQIFQYVFWNDFQFRQCIFSVLIIDFWKWIELTIVFFQ